MSTSNPDDDPIATQAEQVREHLVTLRGGAPFLSPFDAGLLVDWLSAGLPVGAILRAVELAADRRRQKRTHIPLSLRHARSTLKDAVGAARPAPAPLAPLIEALRAGDALEQEVARRLAALRGEGEGLVAEAVATCRWGLGRAWELADQEGLRAQAEAELAGLGADWTPAQRTQAVEEVARDIVRRQHPLLSAARVWDTVYP